MIFLISLAIVLFSISSRGQIILDPSQNPSCKVKFAFEENCLSPKEIIIQSPNYPNEYNVDKQCNYEISVPRGNTAEFDCSHFRGFFHTSTTKYNSNRMQFTQLNNIYYIQINLPSPLKFQCTVRHISLFSEPDDGIIEGMLGNRNLECGNPDKSMDIDKNGNIQGKSPWTVQIYDLNERNNRFCFGSIINPWWILTSAGCIFWHQQTQLFVTSESTVDRNDRSLPIDKVLIHPNYRWLGDQNEIALLQLARPLIFNQNRSAICLPWHLKNTKLDTCTVYSSGSSQTRTYSLISNKECEEGSRQPGSVRSDLICTEDRRRGPCGRVLGGSLDYKDNKTDKFYVVGVMWWSNWCGDIDATMTHTRVTSHLDWILQTTGDSLCV